MNSPPASYGIARERAASVSFADVQNSARKLMAAGNYPSVAAVRSDLKRGSATTISDAMRRFWKDQAALNVGNPVALTRLPPEFADAAVALWEQALRLSLQSAKADDNAARATLDELKRETDSRLHSLELREREWDLAARIRERALVDAREQVNVLLKELAAAAAEVRSGKVQISQLEAQIEEYRAQLANVISRAVSRHRTFVVKKRTTAGLRSKKRDISRKNLGSKKTRNRRRR